MNVVNHEDDLFAGDEPAALSGGSDKWKVLVVDDEEDVHGMTELALEGVAFDGKSLSLLHAYSAEEGIRILSEHPDAALVLLDVVMETETAGLDLATHVRKELGNRLVRIVLWTGRRGKAPEREAMEGYEIDDYRSGTDLTVDHLHAVVTSSLRSYKSAATLDARAGSLERMVRERTEALEKKEARYRELFNHINSGVAVYEARRGGRDFVLKDFNRAGERIDQLKKEDLIGRSVLDVFSGAGVSGLFDALQRVWVTGEPEHLPVSFYENTRIVGWNENYIYKLPSGEIVAVYTDETEKKRGEEKQRQYLTFLENMNRINRVLHQKTDFEQMMGGVLNSVLSMCRCDRAWLLFPCDPHAASWRVHMERTRSEYPGAGCEGTETPMTPDVAERLQGLLDSEEPVASAPGARCEPWALGAGFDVRSSLALAIHPRKGEPWAFGLHQCARSRVWSEDERELFKEIGHRISEILSSLLLLMDLHESENKYKTLTNNLTIGVYRAAPAIKGKIIEANSAIVAIFGYESRKAFLEITIADLFQNPSEVETFDDKLSNEGAIHYENLRLRKRNGEVFVGSVSAVAVKDEKGDIKYYDGMVEDVTGRKNLEDQLRQVQKMEAMGALAGGIAHDFNNILFPIVGFVEMMLEDTPEVSPHHGPLSQVLNAANRARELVKQILSFSRQSEEELKPLKIQMIIKEVLKLIRSSLPTTIEIRRTINEACGHVKADPSHIHQIAMNLITNAYHAMEKTGGVLTIGLSEVHLDTEVLDDPDLTPGAFIRLEVADTGVGMPEHVIHRIFEPYFTTKEKGKGTGLGLSVVNGIVKNYGGFIQVESEPEKGTAFRVYLPVVDFEVETRKQTAGPIPRGSERVMLVDDEEPIIRMERRLLSRLGYKVTTFTSSPDAMEAFKAKPDAFDLIITDMTMPTITGDRLSLEMIKIRPDIPIIMCTGFSEQITEKSAKALGIREFVLKPIVIREIAESIRRALDPSKGKKREPLPAPPTDGPPAGWVGDAPGRMGRHAVRGSDIRVLLVDDEEPIRNSLGWFLEDFDFDVSSVGSAEEALALLETESYHVAIVDMGLPGMLGDELIIKAHEMTPGMRFLILTGSAGIPVSKGLHLMGMKPEHILKKPLDSMTSIVAIIEKMLRK